MLDRFLAFGASFDWISPMAAWIQNLANGPSHTFLIPYNSGWSGVQVQRLLKGYGIKSWGLMVISGTLTVSVRAAQAEWAQYVLQRAGILVENPFTADTRKPALPGPGSPREPRAASDWFDALAEKIGF